MTFFVASKDNNTNYVEIFRDNAKLFIEISIMDLMCYLTVPL